MGVSLIQQYTGHGICIRLGAAHMRAQLSASAADAAVRSPDQKSCSVPLLLIHLILFHPNTTKQPMV